MAANEPLNQLETTDANNTPIGTDVIGSSLDDELRSIKANIARSAREESTATASAAATLAVTVLNKIVPVSGSAAGSTTITLPAAATAGAGFRFTAWKTDNTNNVIIDASGAETINGSADYTMATQYEAAQFVTDGTSWVVESTAKRELGTSDFADDSVTNAKLANMAQDTIKGRATAGTGDPEDLTPAQARTLLDVYQQATADGLFVNVSGDTMAGDLSFGDNNKAQFGAANDLEIFHNATDSVINDAGTGSLKLQNTGSTKLEVTTTGVDVTGNVVSDGADLDGAVTINESGADVDFRVESAVSQHALFLRGSDGAIGMNTGGPQGTLHAISSDAGTNVNTKILATLPGTATQGLSSLTLQGRTGGGGDYDYSIAGSYALGLIFYSPTNHRFNDGTNYTFETSTAATIVNEDGIDHDFRVEGDTNTHALFVQGSDGYVGIGESAPSAPLHITAASTTGTTLGDKDNRILFDALSVTVGNGGEVVWGVNDTPAGRWAAISGSILSQVSGEAIGDIIFGTKPTKADTSLSNRLQIKGIDEAVFNEDGNDYDFRVESATNTHALFVQGSDGAVGIGTSSPNADLHIADNSGAAAGAAQIRLSLDAASTDGFSGLLLASRSGGTDYSPTILTDYLGGINYESPRRHYFDCNAVEVLSAGAASVIVNDPGNDVDFRVESDTNTHALFVQGSDGHVGIGTVPSSSYALHVSDADGILVESTSTVGIHKFVRGTGATKDSRPVIDIDADSQFDAVDGFGPTLRFTISDTGVDDSELGAIGFVRDGSDTQGKFVVGQDSQQLGSVGATQFSVGNAETVVNDQGVDTDFRVESDTNTHALFVQGSDGYVGINESSPGGVLHISNPSTPGNTASFSGTASEFVIDTSADGGMTISTGNTSKANIVFKPNSGGSNGTIYYDNSADEFVFVADSAVDVNAQLSIKQGVQVGAPTGGYKGTGTLNATAVYDDNTLLTDFVLDQAVDGEIDFDFYDSLELGGKAAREWDPRNLDIDWYESQWRERKALPSFRSKAERFDSEGKEIRDSVGTLIQGLQQELETAMVHIAQLNARIKQLEEK